MAIKLQYLAHSAFFIETEICGILIDPFISQNPNADFDYKKHKITHIFVTHGHGDHLGDAIPISKSTGAPIIAVFELGNYCIQNGAKAIPVGLGGKLNFGFGQAMFMPAFHSSSGQQGEYTGMPASILFFIEGKTIYHAGDTCLNNEMKLIGEIYTPDYALLPIGGHFTMGADEASIAASFMQARNIIPMHYNTFPAIKADSEYFKKKITEQGQKAIILKPNEIIEI